MKIRTSKSDRPFTFIFQTIERSGSGKTRLSQMTRQVVSAPSEGAAVRGFMFGRDRGAIRICSISEGAAL